MALIRWQPFREMDSLQRDMNRMFNLIHGSKILHFLHKSLTATKN